MLELKTKNSHFRILDLNQFGYGYRLTYAKLARALLVCSWFVKSAGG